MIRSILIHVILFGVVSLFAQAGNYYSENVELLSQIKPGNESSYSDIWGYATPDGREYALIGAYKGLYAVDITDPVSPVVCGFVRGPSSIWRDVKVHESYAYVVTEGTGTNGGLQIIDLSDLPNSISLVKSTTEYFTTSHNIFIDNGFAYVVGTDRGGGVHIIDLANPVDPIKTSYYGESGYVHDVFVRDSLMVVCAASHYALVDVGNKEIPKLISSSSELPGIYAHSGWMTEDGNYFYATEENNSRDLIVWDISDRNNWNIVVPSWQINSGSIIHNLFIRDNYAHISYYGDGYVILDISDPTQPIKIGQFDTYPDNSIGFNGAWGCYPYFPSGNTVIADIQSGLFVLKFSPGNIEPVIHMQNQIEYVLEAKPVIIEADIVDDGVVVDANLFYRILKDGGSDVTEWLLVEPVDIDNRTYTFEIPSIEPKAQVEYYMGVADNSGNVITLPKGGSGTEPAGKNPPPSFLSYLITIPGVPIIHSTSPVAADTSFRRGNLVHFSVDAEDTSGLPLTYEWYVDGEFKNTNKDYILNTVSYITGTKLNIEVIISNPINATSFEWNIEIISPTKMNDENPVNKFDLVQNYPNPFNPETNITYSIPEQSHVSLKIYNLLGEEIATLVNEIKSSGKHTVRFDANNLSGGIYFAYIEAGTYKKTLKMSLIK